jgi:hypothetical protein
MKTLDQACTPRRSVFEERGKDTVYSLDDLDVIKPGEFFAENFVTEGMKQLLTEVFKRLEGKSKSAAGTFMLSQSMGGGKTHNLVALGLLAKNPDLRDAVMSDFYSPGPLGAVRVVSFSGRKNPQFGIWGEIAEQLNKTEAFQKLYSPLQPPSDDDWVGLLRGDPLLILLDELPPYFQAARAIPVGATFLDSLTTRALANLIVAVNSGKLPNVGVVITDLHRTAYAAGSESLSDLQKEVNREGGYQQIEPVRMASNELYHILRKRLFETVPDESEIGEVAEAFRDQLEKAKVMDVTASSPEQLKADIMASYPFHPGIRDLFARFRENQGYQQTRALIRIMRLVVGTLWESGADGAAFSSVGSSNLTKGGLTDNIELNLTSDDVDLAAQLAEWFDGKWQQGVDCRDEFIHIIEESVLFGARYTPWHIFVKALHAAYGKYLDLTISDDIASKLADFQQEAVTRCVGLLERHWGAMLCDSVGLGKTFEGLGILAEFTRRRQESSNETVRAKSGAGSDPPVAAERTRIGIPERPGPGKVAR